MMIWNQGYYRAGLMILTLLCLLPSTGSTELGTISGTGSGELLMQIEVHSTAPVFSGRYSYDLIGINIPPIESFYVTSGKDSGYNYNIPGVLIPGKPNDFSISASTVKNLNIGVKKDPVKTGINRTRVWVTSQITADENGTATTASDLLSPGRYHIKVFGDAADNSSQVNLTMTLVKKMIINGRFNLSINTSGFPSGDCSINAKALNGSISLDEIALNGLSMVV